MDDGLAVHYTAVARGTPIVSSDGVEVGRVDAVWDNYTEHIFDGIVMESTSGELRFVDAPEVARTAERAVTLTISASETERLPPPDKGGPSFRPRAHGGLLGKVLGGGWRRR